MRRLLALTATIALAASAQVYSPKLLAKGQPDTSDLSRLAQAIYAHSSARTPHERAEAIWRFFLTDGRFVEPGFWYHIAGWAYEEPEGEVLDPLKLLNSYGFGLCYQIAPLLAATWKAGGFADARVWFLTGHTVAEVFYEGAYHYFDSDMMGYNQLANGSVASVRQIEEDGSIITSKLKGPGLVDATRASNPWYPADVREGAIGDLAALFTTKEDNWLMPFDRAPQGHSMNLVLRPGERFIRYFQPERDDLFYLPYKFARGAWLEFPQEIDQYGILTDAGPRSQKDARRWATGRFEYRPEPASSATQVHVVHSPYVIIDAQFEVDAVLPSHTESLTVETSVDDGRTWAQAGRLEGPHSGPWDARPPVLTRTAHGRRTHVSGRYDYLLRLTKTAAVQVRDLLLTTDVQLNPRTLPELRPGHNVFTYSAGPERIYRKLLVDSAEACAVAHDCRNARFISDGSQGYWVAEAPGSAELVFHIRAPAGGTLATVHAGARFLDLGSGLTPDKFTAEVRRVAALPARRASASIAWSTSAAGPYRTVWQYDPHIKWLDNAPVTRVLRWPEVDRDIPVNGVPEVFVRYRLDDLGVDSFRLSSEVAGISASPLDILQSWQEGSVSRTHRVRIPARTLESAYSIDVPEDATVSNQAIIFECLGARRTR